MRYPCRHSGLGAYTSILIAFGISACGGGGSPPPPPPPAGALSGTAAIGAPLANAGVTAKCTGGTSEGRTDSAGHFSVELPESLHPPCVLKAAAPWGDLISVSPTINGTANVTPLTHLLAARLVASSPVRLYSEFPQESVSRIASQGISAAQGEVAAEILKLGAAMPAANWINQPFEARPDDAMDGALELLSRKLAEHNKTLEGAAVELATGPLYPTRPVEMTPECVPGLISGFNGPIQDAISRVVRARDSLDPGGSGDASGGAQGGADGVGIGGSLGQFVNVDVMVRVANGPTYGPKRADPTNGMVTFVPCSHTPPLYIKIQGTPGSGAMYYDEARGELVSFENLSIEGIGTRFDRNLGVTPFTDAIVRRSRALADTQSASGGFPLKRLASQAEGWTDMGRVQIAHDEVRRALNDQLPGMYRIDDLTRLPVMLNQQNDRQGSQALTDNPNGIYGAVVSGFANVSSGEQVQSASAPAYLKGEQFSRDMADGNLDRLEGTAPLSEAASGSAYEVDQLWIESTIGTGRTAIRAGSASLADRRGIVMIARTGETGNVREYFHSTSGRLTIVDKCLFPGNGCENKDTVVGDFRQAQVLMSPNVVAAITWDRLRLKLYQTHPGSAAIGADPVPVADFPAPNSGASFSAIRHGLIALTDGSIWTVNEEGLPDAYRLVQVSVPPEVVDGTIGYFAEDIASRPLGSPLGYGLTSAGGVVVWNLRDTGRKRTVALPPSTVVVQLSTNQSHVLARTNKNEVFWINPEHAQRIIGEEPGEQRIEPLFPELEPTPVLLSQVQDSCWIAMPFVLDCDGRARELETEIVMFVVARTPQGFGGITQVRAVPIDTKIWRITPEVRPTFHVAVFHQSVDARLIAIDGTIYSKRGEIEPIPEVALE